ncbi:uncharacterized protein LOC130054920 [Ostrea edulis]|uniref:uncharacterized protein LOC130054920 n=1 Tax=Ostrea edulis TaxID=37623 RepID=UPI0024AEFE85|nr:uncharacterized protein LOC130054920 [Ostrea edulis]
MVTALKDLAIFFQGIGQNGYCPKRHRGTIAEKALFSLGDANLPPQSHPKLANLVRIANRTREKLRPQEPKYPDFVLVDGFLPTGFLKADISSDGQRYLLFATEEQLDVLADLQTWFVDGTFKVVRSPFVQLFSIHGFLGNQQKQVPLLFAFMTRRQTSDYITVLREVINILPRRAVVQTVVADFEKATWSAVRTTIPGVSLFGCNFHWSQAVWRKVQEVGLQTLYTDDRHVYTKVRNILPLPFLPVDIVQEDFTSIKQDVESNPALTSLVAYVERNWVESNTFPIPSWNVYKKDTRTNNDCKGWHRRLNNCAMESTPPFYILVPMLYSEVEKLPLQRQMVAEGSLQRLQRKEVRERQQSYEDLWGQYEEGLLTGRQLLQQFSKVCGPRRG